MTLLEMAQDISNDLEVDEFDSITDTMEAVQIAQIIRTTYFELIDNRNWNHLRTTFLLTDGPGPTRPTHLTVPQDVKEVITFSVNQRTSSDTSDKFQEIYFVQPEEFLRRINARRSNNNNVTTVTDTGGISLFIRNDKRPEYFTSFNDDEIVLDSYQIELDTFFPGIKTQVIGYRSPSWTHEDSFIPDLPEEAFSNLLAEAKSVAFLVLKQAPNSKAEQQSTRQKRWLSRKDWKVSGGVRYPDFGRKTRGFRQNNPLLDKESPRGTST